VEIRNFLDVGFGYDKEKGEAHARKDLELELMQKLGLREGKSS